MLNLFPSKLKSTLCILLAACTIATFTACGRETKPETPNTPPAVEQQAPKEEKIPSKDLITAPDNTTKLHDANIKNKDTVGWLTVPNTTIDNSVMQGKNNLFYHRLDENKQYKFTGCFYADYENTIGSRDILSKNTLIYGHNIDYNDNKDGQRFSQLFHYADIDFMKENPYIFFDTLDEQMVFEIFAASYTATNLRYVEVNDMT
ncbi:MAG: class B sortase, partial [Oscillospiraceae bacterium]